MIDDKMSSVRERVASEAALRGDYETANRLYEEYGSRISGGVKNVLTAIPAEELNTFLQYAPEQVRVNFGDTNNLLGKLSDNEKRKLMKIFRYTHDSIQILDKTGKCIIAMANKDYQLSDQECVPGLIQNDSAGNTSFHVDALKTLDGVPKGDDWKKMITAMPTGDYKEDEWCTDGAILYYMLGGTGRGVYGNTSNNGGFYYGADGSVLRVYKNEGVLIPQYSNTQNLLAVRLIKI